MESTISRSKAKLRFISLYVIGLILIFVVVSSFWQEKVESQQSNTEEAIQLANKNAEQEVEELKRQVGAKDQKIASLEASIQQNASTVNVPANQNQASSATAEKDRQIADLQNQLKQKETALQNAMNATQPTTTVPSGDGGEWKQKYSSLKASFDKVSANEKALQSAYKTVADDNKRLLAQLQSMRKE